MMFEKNQHFTQGEQANDSDQEVDAIEEVDFTKGEALRPCLAITANHRDTQP